MTTNPAAAISCHSVNAHLDSIVDQGPQKIGLQAGELWRVGDGGIYLTSLWGSSSPFNNPKFVEIYTKVNQVAYFQFRDSNLSFKSFCRKASQLFEKHVSQDDLSVYNDHLQEAIQAKNITQPSAQGSTACQRMSDLMEALIKGSNPFQQIEVQAKEDGKNCAQITPWDEETLQLLENELEAIFNLKPFFWLLKQTFSSPEICKHLFNMLQERGKALDLGVLLKPNYHHAELIQLMKSLRPDFERLLASELSTKELVEVEHTIRVSKKVSRTLQARDDQLMQFMKSLEELSQLEAFEEYPSKVMAFSQQWSTFDLGILKTIKDEAGTTCRSLVGTLLDVGSQISINLLDIDRCKSKNDRTQVIDSLKNLIIRLEKLCSDIEAIIKEGDWQVNLSFSAYFQRDEHLALLRALMNLHQTAASHRQNRIAYLFQRHPKTLFVVRDPEELEDVKNALLNKNITFEGPIKFKIKPRGLFWEIKKEGRKVGYFLGSMHQAPQHLIEQINSRILGAFDGSDVLAVEVDITREAVIQEFVSLIESSSKLKDRLIENSDWMKVALVDLKISPDETETDPEFSKKALALIIEKLKIVDGLDIAFIKKAKSRNIPVVDLDTIELQKKQLSKDRASLTDLDTMLSLKPLEIWELIKAYVGVLNEYASHIETGIMNFPQPYEPDGVMIERNIEMTNSNERLIKEGKLPFSVVGYAHFIGKDGMVELMRRRGYEVTQIFVDEPLTEG